MTTPEIFMWAATAMNIAGLVTSVWHMRTRAKHGKRLAAISKDLFSLVENELQMRVELIKEVMQLRSERNDLRDAAEFEERVNRKLITTLVWAYDDGWDDRLNVREYKGPDLEGALKWARLEVEEEMDG